MEGGTTNREGKEQAFAFSVRKGQTVGDCCIVSVLREDIVRSWYGVKEKGLFEG